MLKPFLILPLILVALAGVTLVQASTAGKRAAEPIQTACCSDEKTLSPDALEWDSGVPVGSVANTLPGSSI